MNGLAVSEQDDAQHAVFHFSNPRPAANSAIGLDFLAQWVSNDTLDPFILNHRTVGALTGVLKVLRGLHSASIILEVEALEELAGVAIVVSLDRICTHLIVFEGDSIAKIYVGNWSDYETMMMEKFGKDLTPH